MPGGSKISLHFFLENVFHAAREYVRVYLFPAQAMAQALLTSNPDLQLLLRCDTPCSAHRTLGCRVNDLITPPFLLRLSFPDGSRTPWTSRHRA